MRKSRDYIYAVCAAVLALLAGTLAGCTADSGDERQAAGRMLGTLELTPSLGGQVSSRGVLTRSQMANDNCSRWQFDGSDRIGFYSSTMPDGNVPMHYTADGTFMADDGKLVDYNNMGQCFAYCPYYENMADGMPVRAEGDICEDLLGTSSVGFIAGQGLTAEFTHAFVLLMIKGDTGFEHLLDSDAPDIKVYTSKPVNKVYAGYGGIGFDIKAGDNADPALNRFGGRKGGLSSIDFDKEHGWQQGEVKETVYCVILPYSTAQGILLSHVEATDDEGGRHQIDITGLNGSLKPGDRAVVTLKMDGLTPTIRPTLIEEWNGNTVIDDGHPEGINMPVDFGHWATAYNSYKGGDTSKEEDLRKYGYKDEKGVWHFFLNTDITYQGGVAGAVVIHELSDELDGRGHTITGLSLRNTEGSAAFIDIINGGTVKNLRMESLSIESHGAYAGGIAAEMTAGTVSNCTLTRLRVSCPGGDVGGLVGHMTGGEASWCTLRGIILGGSTVDNVIGAGTQAGLTGVDAVNVVFGKQNKE